MEVVITELGQTEAEEVGAKVRITIRDLGNKKILETALAANMSSGFVWAGKFIHQYAR